MPLRQLSELLDSNNISYKTIAHSPSYTAQQTAQLSHVPGREFAKTVVLKADGRMVMVVMPAHRKVKLSLLREELGVDQLELAHEYEFSEAFPGCELGAMPPFGELFNMELYASKELAEDKNIVFNAGTHTELIRLAWEDFIKLAHPQILASC